MIWVLALILTLAAGWMLARVMMPAVFAGARPAVRLGVEFGLAVLIGPGLSSAFFWVLPLTGRFDTLTTLLVAGVFTAAATGIYLRFRPPVTENAVPHSFPWTWILWIAFALACVFVVLDFSAATKANPNGDWDAWAIWNMRAKFLAGGSGMWHRALAAEAGGSMLGSSHPGYPLCLSAYIAALWTVSGDYTSAVPITVSLLVSAALVVLLAASLAALRSTSIGLLAGVILAGTELYSSQTAWQYSDLLEGLAFLASVVLLAAIWNDPAPSRRTLIALGLSAGLAPWIKNEGIPFAAALLALIVWRWRFRGLPWAALGALPGLAATLSVKLLAVGREGVLPGSAREAVTKILDVSRWWQTLSGLITAVWQLGFWWAHPVLLVVILAWALGFVPSRERWTRAWLAFPLIAAIAADFGVFLVTRAGLDWHLKTSATRLVIQLWPPALWVFLSVLRTPDDHFPARVQTSEPPPDKAQGRKRRAKTSD